MRIIETIFRLLESFGLIFLLLRREKRRVFHILKKKLLFMRNTFKFYFKSIMHAIFDHKK